MLWSKKCLEFKEKLGLDPCKYHFDEQDTISSLQVAFAGEIVHTQYCIQNKRLDGYSPKYKRGIEIDEYDHLDKNFEDGQSRQLMIEEKIDCKIIRTETVDPDFNIYRLMNQIRTRIEQLTIKSIKNSLVDDLSKDSLEAAIKLKSKCKEEGSKLVKKTVKNVLTDYKKWEISEETKPKYVRKKISSCLKCGKKQKMKTKKE